VLAEKRHVWLAQDRQWSLIFEVQFLDHAGPTPFNILVLHNMGFPYIWHLRTGKKKNNHEIMQHGVWVSILQGIMAV
jgi:hypothetical protein